MVILIKINDNGLFGGYFVLLMRVFRVMLIVCLDMVILE